MEVATRDFASFTSTAQNAPRGSEWREIAGRGVDALRGTVKQLYSAYVTPALLGSIDALAVANIAAGLPSGLLSHLGVNQRRETLLQGFLTTVGAPGADAISAAAIAAVIPHDFVLLEAPVARTIAVAYCMSLGMTWTVQLLVVVHSRPARPGFAGFNNRVCMLSTMPIPLHQPQIVRFSASLRTGDDN